MKPTALRFLFLFLAALPFALAGDGPVTIQATEARKHIGETVVVVGHVDGVRKFDSGTTLINLDGRYPNQALTVVVKSKDATAVGDVAQFDGKTVRVTGKIIEYRDSPEIELTSKTAITEVKP